MLPSSSSLAAPDPTPTPRPPPPPERGRGYLPVQLRRLYVAQPVGLAAGEEEEVSLPGGDMARVVLTPGLPYAFPQGSSSPRMPGAGGVSGATRP